MTAEENHSNFARTTVHSSIKQWQGMVVEMWLTFILVQTVWGATNKKRRRVFTPSLPIGLAVALDILTGVCIGCSALHQIDSFVLEILLVTCCRINAVATVLFWKSESPRLQSNCMVKLESTSLTCPFLSANWCNICRNPLF